MALHLFLCIAPLNTRPVLFVVENLGRICAPRDTDEDSSVCAASNDAAPPSVQGRPVQVIVRFSVDSDEDDDATTPLAPLGLHAQPQTPGICGEPTETVNRFRDGMKTWAEINIPESRNDFGYEETRKARYLVL
jgi:hypothetical protein